MMKFLSSTMKFIGYAILGIITVIIGVSCQESRDEKAASRMHDQIVNATSSSFSQLNYKIDELNSKIEDLENKIDDMEQ